MISTRTLRLRTGLVVTGAVVAAAMSSLVPQAQAVAPNRTAGACTQIVTGSLPGAQTVAAGDKLCLRGATVDGAITVEPGASLSARNSTVKGAITLAGSDNFKFCGSTTVNGAISASSGVGVILIGDNDNCAGNTIDGAITIESNARNVTLARTETTGSVTVNSNDSSTGKGPKIAGNDIGGNLTCSANVPAPTNTGRPNSVYGARGGQCASPSF